jgi:hypothetical protein
VKKYLIGFDPGGKRAFGWCVIQDGCKLPLGVIDAGVADHAQGAVHAAYDVVQAKRGKVVGVGIDAPLFWVGCGCRQVDKDLRREIQECGGPKAARTVQQVNSLRGACLVQGMLAGVLSRKRTRHVPISESHPKAAIRLWCRHPRIALRRLTAEFFTLPEDWRRSDKGYNLRDAGLAALSAWAMVHKRSDWRNLYPDEERVYSLVAPPLAYWMPKQNRGGREGQGLSS